MPVSYILASRETGSRTIVHSRNIAELTSVDFEKQVTRYMKEVRQDLNAPVWFHFEGRNMEVVREMMLYARSSVPNSRISVEIEFPRYDWSLAKTLASLADYVFMSKDYIRDKINLPSARDFFDGIIVGQWGENWNEWVKAFICPWGSEGVHYLEMEGATIHHIPAEYLDNVVESNGAGDSFIGASLAGLSRRKIPLNIVLKTACDVATTKCSQHGFKLRAERTSKWQQDLQHWKESDEGLSSNKELHNQNDGDTETHCVTSEVALELESITSLEQQNDESRHFFAVRQLPALLQDDDGDLIVPRKRIKLQDECFSHQHHGIEDTSSHSDMENVFLLEAQTYTTWKTAGTQLWRAAFLLVDFMFSAPELFANRTVLELGCGIGFTSIVASRLSSCVYATDSDVSALRLTQRNAQRNKHGNVLTRLLDWNDCAFASTRGEDCAAPFDWVSGDQEKLNGLRVIIASDVFYDDTTTLLFLRALRSLMLKYDQAKAYVAAERRPVFSAEAMNVVSLGYDTFQEHICTHEPSQSRPEAGKNRVACTECSAAEGSRSDGELLRFVVRDIKTNSIPQRFQYERLSTLMIWAVDGVVV